MSVFTSSRSMSPHAPHWRLRALACAALLCLSATGHAQDAAVPAVSAPAQDLVAPRVTRANWLMPANIRWAMRNTRLVVPTAGIRHADVAAELPEGASLALDDMRLAMPEGRTATFAQYLAGNRVDGLLVLHRGRVVHERYYGGMDMHDAHGWASMSKSVIGLLAAQLVEEGRLDPAAPVSRYVPELADTPFGKATVQQNLDMEVALAYLPQLPPDIGLFTAAGLLPAREGMPGTIHDFLLTATRSMEASHGSTFYYQNGATESVAWALRRITGKALAQLVGERLWRPMGAQDDAYFSVDAAGVEFAAGGLSSTLRDAARFGELVRNQGRIGGRQVVPREALARILRAPSAGNQERLARAGRNQTGYGNFWWYPGDTQGALYASGRFGQRLYVDPANELTLVQFGAYADTRARSVSGNQAAAAHENELRSGDALVALARAIEERLAGAGR
ncbi:beta-lactamase family protein [Acidovorax sp. Be4]|uniref:Beta-lactamase family protein n=1 Tax=Acidovorax bellezanensis TaxID=2976702 RepID=A0ABT2PMP5_9BURK|nr:serine hydrolase [Acidovorax sp. Be4]MCT9811751.1 beta-lactamase family protein [Acidovorax sp. Be4]